jgi:hypothetical protein
VLVGLAGSYPVYIAIAHSVFDASIPIDDRMFSPVFVALVALLGVVAALVSRQQRARWILLPLMAVMLVAFLPHMVGRFSGKYESMRQDGVLLAGRAWRESGSVAWVRSLPAEALLYSNQALALEFLTGRSVYAMPTRVDTVKNEARPEFDAQLTGMRADLKRPNSYLLVFNPLNPMAPEDLQGVYADGLRVLQITGDGFVMVEAGAGGPG